MMSMKSNTSQQSCKDQIKMLNEQIKNLKHKTTATVTAVNTETLVIDS